MIGTLVQVHLYTFSYRKPLFRPRIVPKIGNWCETVTVTVKNAKSKNNCLEQKIIFKMQWAKSLQISWEKLKKSNRLVIVQLQEKWKNATFWTFFRPRKSDPYGQGTADGSPDEGLLAPRASKASCRGLLIFRGTESGHWLLYKSDGACEDAKSTASKTNRDPQPLG